MVRMKFAGLSLGAAAVVRAFAYGGVCPIDYRGMIGVVGDDGMLGSCRSVWRGCSGLAVGGPMAGGVSWPASSGIAPLPVSKRPPIRPVGVRPLGELTVFVIVATMLQAVVMGWGLWLFDGLRRDLHLMKKARRGTKPG